MDTFVEYVIGDRDYFAVVPDRVLDAQAATLPVAGLTALAAVDKGDRILGRSALITGVNRRRGSLPVRRPRRLLKGYFQGYGNLPGVGVSLQRTYSYTKASLIKLSFQPD